MSFLKKETDKIVLKIKDNGEGILEKHLSDQRAFGSIGMRERARPLRGEVKISGTSGKGTLVVVTIPLAGKENLDAANTNRR